MSVTDVVQMARLGNFGMRALLVKLVTADYLQRVFDSRGAIFSWKILHKNNLQFIHTFRAASKKIIMTFVLGDQSFGLMHIFFYFFVVMLWKNNLFLEL